MALLWMDGFDHLDQAHLLGIYNQRSTGATVTSTYKRTGTRALELAGNDWLECWLQPQSTITVGVAIYLRAGAYHPTGDYIRLYDGASIQATLQITDAGYVRVTRGGSVVLGSTIETLIPLSAWHYLEFRCTISHTGSFEVRLDGRPILTGTGDTQATANAYADRIRLYSPGSYTDYDDLYVTDGPFLGDIKVVTVLPDANGTHQDWSPSSGIDHWSLVDEAPANDDTDYLYASTVGATETEQFQDVSLTGNILGVMQLACVRKDDAGSREAALICRSGGVAYEGPQTSIGNTYTYLIQIRETNPASGSPWTVPELNAAEFGLRMKV